jgi:RNA polymerase sigma factor (sigma-70 family)
MNDRCVAIPQPSATGSGANEAPDRFDDAAAAACTARMVAGDRTAFEALFRRRCVLVESESLRRLGRRRDLADDAAQETWLRVARTPRACPDLARLDAWLRKIVASAAIDLLRGELARRTRERRVAGSRPEAVAFLEDFALLEEIRHEAARLPGLTADERSMFELRVRTGATVERLAGWLGLGRAALDSTLRRAAERARRMTP